MSKEKVVLAYSGGLDTSVIVHWLTSQGYDVIGLCLDLGQKVENLDEIRQKGLKAGAVEVLIEDVRKEFVEEYVLRAIEWNAVYEGTYLLGTSLARPLIAKKQIEAAERFGASTVSHGATGKGNDQVRFELGYYALKPDIKIIAPWKVPEFYQRYPGRAQLIEYAQQNGIPVKATTEQPWSTDENLMHISFESGMLEDPWQEPREEMFELSQSPKNAPDQEQTLTIDFEEGTPRTLDGQDYEPVDLLTKLNEIGGRNGIGRVDLVESRFVGMKSRGVYETPGGTILNIAHRAMESLTLDRGVINLKDSLMPRFSQLVYNGFWFSPEMEILLEMGRSTQKRVSGTVRLKLYRGNCMVTGRKSDNSLYDEDIATMEADEGNYDPRDSNGFIRLNALPLRIHRRLTSKA
ncbi:MAG: argininosuccinate synthase [SAR324 cluster bacterium]|jgi:argininosuccinate synthase|nr:argininosuccinate synthase [Deltaproteobacteria bacterium]MAD99899.1 argininosuccinate synthase [Pseudomonadota bacterium]MDP6091169.1 argininosuccinate synthase [SAR324 cluster bacterium]MBI14607.1 argininosuccinate synthase [Deltaproteobacteria bacterium]MBP45629.1 argininosuccinate synthase [Deltaproteobacteria bacterium]|tara:strand:- start:293 stop:1510 length:1218 start_codon:yes stop_codon:yes gene_type:complete